MKIDFANLQLQYQTYKEDIDAAISGVLNKSNYIMGSEVAELESRLQDITGSSNAITCSSGTDALLLAMMAIDIQPGDEIITTPFTFIATAETIALLKAKPVFVDIDPETFNINPKLIEAAITSKTKAIMPVSLFGQPPEIDEIQKIATRHNLKTIIDGAQSFCSKYNDVTDSNLGDISTTSFFPAKPLGCYGDGGAIFTNDSEIALKIKSLRLHGQSKRYHHDLIGMGGRLDTIQAAILLAKLPHYEDELIKRNDVALKYSSNMPSSCIAPKIHTNCTSAWAQYTVRNSNRDELQQHLSALGVPTAIHYPVPLHLQQCFKYLGYSEKDFPESVAASNQVLSLPMNPFMSLDEIEFILESISTINK